MAPDPGQERRILQLSDPHLLAVPAASYRDVNPHLGLRHGLDQALELVGERPDLLLITGDLCQDESLAGYHLLRALLEPLGIPLALLPGNHDDPALLRQVFGSTASLAPAVVPLGDWRLLLLSSHCSGSAAGVLDPAQLAWLGRQLADADTPTWVAIHHPPVAIGSPGLDAIALQRPEPLLALLAGTPAVRGLVFGHVHQHWQGALPGRPEVPLLGCPSTLCAFEPAQPCPLDRPGDPGGRWLELGPEPIWRQRLLRWRAPMTP